MNRPALWFVLAIALVVGWSSFFTVDETEVAIVTQFGAYKRSSTTPGLKWKIPLIQEVHRMDSRVMGFDDTPKEYLSLDKKRLMADPITRWKIVDPLRFYTVVHDEVGLKARLSVIVNSELRREIANHEFEAIIGSGREGLMTSVATQVRSQAEAFGVNVVDVRIKRADLPPQVQESVFARMRAERDRVAKKHRSEGEEEAAKIRADTDKEKTIILAKAYEEAQRTRGHGDASSVKIYGEAYGKDPEFYAFQRRLESYEQSFDVKSTVILSTGSGFFRYLGGPGAAER
jgi:membrane protease subunit HflC